MRSILLASILACVAALPAAERLATRDALVSTSTHSNSQVVTSKYTTCPTIAGEPFGGIEIAPVGSVYNGSYLVCLYQDGQCGYNAAGNLVFTAPTSANSPRYDVCEDNKKSFARSHSFATSSCYTVCPKAPKGFKSTTDGIDSHYPGTNPYYTPYSASSAHLTCGLSNSSDPNTYYVAAYNITSGALIPALSQLNNAKPATKAIRANATAACLDVVSYP